jgi:hypothetical protein
VADIVVGTAKLSCMFAGPPGSGSLTVVPMGPPTQSGNQAIATVMDHVPMLNIAQFPLCTGGLNPTAKATGTGVCTPTTAAPWSPGSSTVTVGGKAALTSDSTLDCALGSSPTGGKEISIFQAGQSGVTTG